MTLSELKLEFKYWRSNKKSKKEPIPDALWKKVFVLSEKYDDYKVCRELSISSYQFKKNRTKFTDSNFIEIPLAPVKLEGINCNCNIALNLKDKTLSMDVSINQLPELLYIFENWVSNASNNTTA